VFVMLVLQLTFRIKMFAEFFKETKYKFRLSEKNVSFMSTPRTQ